MSPQRADPLEAHVRAVILRFVHDGASFQPTDIADAVALRVGRVPIDQIARLVRGVFDSGVLRPFGYRRTLTKERTRSGIVSAVQYGPVTRAPTDRASSVAPSTAPTRTPPVRPYPYLDIDRGGQRRLERQTRAVESQIVSTTRSVVRTGELLSAIHALTGPQGFSTYVRRELSMSDTTARRLMRVWHVFGHLEDADGLARVRPSVLYKLAEVSFPAPLRAAILDAPGLIIDGRPKALEALTVGDVGLAKRRFGERAQTERAWMRRRATAEGEQAQRLSAALSDLSRQSIIRVDTPGAIERHEQSAERLVRAAAKMAASNRPVSPTVRRQLERLLSRWEDTGDEDPGH